MSDYAFAQQMTGNNHTSKLDLTRRKILAASTAVGASGLGAGFGASALFSDQEEFTNNLFTAGEFDLKVDWEVDYYNGISPDPVTISDSDTDDDGDLELVDDPGPIVNLEDVKPGDVIQHTLSLHLFGNPGFMTMDGLPTVDSDNGFTEPEDQVDGALNDADGTTDGDLDNHLQCVVWFDDGDGLPQEICTTSYSQRDAFIEDLIDGNVSFDTTAEEFLFQGTLASLMSTLSGGLLLDPRVNGHVADPYPNSLCYQPSETEYIGVLCWLPRDIPGVDDNIVQSDRLEYRLGFDAIQCRHNIANDGRPDQRPTAGIQPLTFEVAEGYGRRDEIFVDLQSNVGFDDNLTMKVDTKDDPVVFRLDAPQQLNNNVGDQWSLLLDTDLDRIGDSRLVFDDFVYQEWDEGIDDWGPEQSIPDDLKVDVNNSSYLIRIPRDRLSDPFSFGAHLRYVGAMPARPEDLIIDMPPDFNIGLPVGDAVRYQVVSLGGQQTLPAGKLFPDNPVESLRSGKTIIIEVVAVDSMNNPTKIRGFSGFNLRQGKLSNFPGRRGPFRANIVRNYIFGHNATKTQIGKGHYIIFANLNENIKKIDIGGEGVVVEKIDSSDSRHIANAPPLATKSLFFQTNFWMFCPKKEGWIPVLAVADSWKPNFDIEALKNKIKGSPSPIPPNLLSTEFISSYLKVRVSCKSARNPFPPGELDEDKSTGTD